MKIRNRFVRTLLIVIAVLIGLPLGVTLVLYLAAPIYKFDEPKPFSGSYVNNPYRDMNPDEWKQCNFQSHARTWGGLTDGRNNSEQLIDSIFRLMNYDHVSISNYMRINEYGSDRPDYIPCYEHGIGIFKTHGVCIGAERVWYVDYLFSQSLSIKQYKLHKLSEASRLVAIAHPVFFGGYKVREMAYLSDYRMLEVLNPYGNSVEHWDVALSNGHRAYIIANDDTHDVNNPNLLCRRFTMINTPVINTEAVCSALENGNAYGVDFSYVHDEPYSVKYNRIRELPHLTRAELVADTFFVAASKPTARVVFVGQDGKLLKDSRRAEDNFYVVGSADTYVRAELHFPDGTKFYLNPLTRHQSAAMTEVSLAHVDVLRTWMMRVVYILTVVAVVYMLRKKDSKNEDGKGEA